MARTNATNFTGPLQFPYATAGTDIFKKEDVQTLAQALDQHDHSSGKGLIVNTAALPAGSIAGSALADGGVTSAKIADGTIVAADIADATVTNAKLGPDVARDNLLVNGGMEIWQRGNGPFTANGTYSADRWYPEAGTLSVNRDTANVDSGSGACAAVVSSSTGGAFSQSLTDQKTTLGGRVVSWSVRVKTATANAVRLRLDGNTTGTPSAYHSGNGTYQTLTVTETIPVGVSSIIARVLLDVACTAYLDNACLVVGSQAANYVPLHPADDLARCLRYFQVIGGTNGSRICVAQAYAPTAALGVINYAQKAVTPTLTANGAFNATQAGGTQVAATLSASSITVRDAEIDATTSGMVAGNATVLMATSASASSFNVEANP